jgi:hypothetical protein
MVPSGLVIFCDDIREEVGGKVTLAGCYGNDMRFTGVSFPIIIPKLAIYVMARLPLDQPFPPLQLHVYFPGDGDSSPFVKIDVPHTGSPPAPVLRIDHPDLEKAASLRFPVVISPALFKEPGIVRVRLMYGEKRLRLGSLAIFSDAPAQPPNRLPS